MKLKCLMAILLCAGAMQAQALRCGNQLILKNDSPAKLLKYCGEPTDKAADEKVIKDRAGNKTISKLSRWTYNFGAEDFLYIVTIKAGKIVTIDTDGYGY